jgi:hypothetical protein
MATYCSSVTAEYIRLPTFGTRYSKNTIANRWVMPVITNVINRTSCAGPQHKRKPQPKGGSEWDRGYTRDAGEGDVRAHCTNRRR